MYGVYRNIPIWTDMYYRGCTNTRYMELALVSSKLIWTDLGLDDVKGTWLINLFNKILKIQNQKIVDTWRVL